MKGVLMSIIFWILITISVIISLVTSGVIWAVSKSVVPPMVDAVPNFKWGGLAKVLVALSDLVVQYPLLLIVWPCTILCIGIFVHQNKKTPNEGSNIMIPIIITVLSVVFLLGILFLAIAGSRSMQEQMVSGMGLGV